MGVQRQSKQEYIARMQVRCSTTIRTATDDN